VSKHERSKLIGILGNGQFWHLLAYHFLGMLATYAVIGWLPTFLRNDFGYSAVQAGFIGALVTGALAAFSPVAGTISDRLGVRTPVLLCGSIMSAFCFILFLFSKNTYAVLGSALLLGASMAFTIPVLMILVGERFGKSGAGLAVSIAGTTGQISSSLSGVIFGYALQATGTFFAVWSVALLCAVGRIPFLFWTRESRFHNEKNK
jgi:MFS family permease